MSNTKLAGLLEEQTRLKSELDDLMARNGDDPSSWPPGQFERYENVGRAMDRVDDNIAAVRAERAEKVEAGRQAMQTATNRESATPDGGRVRASGNAERDAAARVVDAVFRSGDLPDHAAEKVESLLDNGMPADRSLAAQWATATGSTAYRDAFFKVLSDPARGHLLWTAEEADAYRAVAEVQSSMRGMTLTDSAGGYMVPLTLDPSIILTSAGSINPLRRVSRVVQTMTDTWQGVSSAGVTAEWTAEAAEMADATPTLAGPSVPVHKGDAFVPYSFEVGMDALNFQNELGRLLVDAADQLQATAYTTGSGSGQPTGIITALAGGASVVTPTTAETFQAADVYKVIEAVPPRFRGNASWQANLSVANLIDQFETTNGARKFPELDNDRLLRRPFNENSNMDGAWDVAATANNYLLLAGDFSNFVIADRIGTTVEVAPHLFGANGRPNGQRGLIMWFRTGSDSVNDNAFRVLNLATTA